MRERRTEVRVLRDLSSILEAIDEIKADEGMIGGKTLRLDAGRATNIGTGAGRVSYFIKGLVIKCPYHVSGKAQSRAEWEIYQREKDNFDFLNELMYFDEDGYLVERVCATLSPDHDFFVTIYDWMEYAGLGDVDNLKGLVTEFCRRNGLLFSDVEKTASWGIAGGKLVLFDFGTTNEIYDKYYSGNLSPASLGAEGDKISSMEDIAKSINRAISMDMF